MPDTHLVEPPKQADPQIPCRDVLPEPTHAQNSSIVTGVARLYWMLVGNAVLYLAAIGITQQDHGGPWVSDAIFWSGVASLLLVRYLDIARLRGATASGEPASFGDWSRYARRLCLLSLTVWVLAHAVAWLSFDDAIISVRP